jgi:hypothetical protein
VSKVGWKEAIGSTGRRAWILNDGQDICVNVVGYICSYLFVGGPLFDGSYARLTIGIWLVTF